MDETIARVTRLLDEATPYSRLKVADRVEPRVGDFRFVRLKGDLGLAAVVVVQDTNTGAVYPLPSIQWMEP